ncbi:hypothetical protein [Bifidobacterium parmae]|uniref:Uncharacterized protein n=1 Tax=Bifidobacterium parmae TaxID=361854 RepID=A0A2N5IZZ7_9BIFI|nr:hypothetical protein [Bifidobacterium parmae]PLS27521.1 hypothetical protein Uis4E_1553 [Bifidobacterium parmae]
MRLAVAMLIPVLTVLLLVLLVAWIERLDELAAGHARPYPAPPRHWSGRYSKPRSRTAEGLHPIHITIKEDIMADEPFTQPQGDSLPPDTIQPMSELASEKALAYTTDDTDDGKEA